MRSEKLTEAGKQEWYYADGQNPVGPFTEQEMKDFYTSGKLQDNSLSRWNKRLDTFQRF